MIVLFKLFLKNNIKNSKYPIYIYGIFTISIVFYALLLSPSGSLTPLIAKSIIWINILLSCSLFLTQQFYAQEAKQGILEQWMVMPINLEWIIAMKWLSHWLLSALPIMLLVPFLSLVLQLDSVQIMPLIGHLLLGSIIISAISSIGAAAMLSERQDASITLLFILPLLLPVLLLGAGGATVMLVGMAAITLPLSVIAGAAMLRAHLS